MSKFTNECVGNLLHFLLALPFGLAVLSVATHVVRALT